MSEYHEADSYMVFLRIALAIAIGTLIASLVREDPDERVRRVQIQYEQVEDQLEQAHTVGGLILNDKENTFTFVSPTEGTCTGTYKESGDNNEVVVITDELACTHSVPVVEVG